MAVSMTATLALCFGILCEAFFSNLQILLCSFILEVERNVMVGTNWNGNLCILSDFK